MKWEDIKPNTIIHIDYFIHGTTIPYASYIVLVDGFKEDYTLTSKSHIICYFSSSRLKYSESIFIGTQDIFVKWNGNMKIRLAYAKEKRFFCHCYKKYKFRNEK